MTYRDDRTAHAQRIDDLTAQLSGLRSARASLATIDEEEAAILRTLDAIRRASAPSIEHLRRQLPMIDRIEIASPCDVPWDSMRGDDRQRFCERCQLHVFDIASMTRAEVTSWMGAEGRKCGRLYRRADGTVLTADCPVGLRRKPKHAGNRRLVLAVAVSVTAAAAILTALSMYYQDHARARVTQGVTTGAASM